MLLDHAVEQTPADSPSKPELSRALHLIHRALDEGRAVMRGLHTPSAAPLSLEQTFSNLLDEVNSGPGVQLRVVAQGRARALNPAIQEQLLMIGREAIMNALRHSEATKIEVEVHYLFDLIRVCVHDVVLSEYGPDLSRFPTEKQFVSHVTLARTSQPAQANR